MSALTLACGGDDSSTSGQPVSSGGNTASGGTTSTGGTSASAGKSGATSVPAAGTSALAGRPAAGSGAGALALAGRAGGGTAGIGDQEDAGVPDAGLIAGAGGAAGSGIIAGAGGASAGQAGAAAGRGGSSGAGGGAGGGGGATFTQVYAMFMTNCMGSGCHVGATRAGDMLSMPDKNTAFINLVNVASVACSGEKRIVPNQPDKSVLVHALQHTRIGSCARTPQMPDNKPMLSQSNIQLVIDWVNAGAPNN